MDKFYQNAFARNLGILTDEQQAKLQSSAVAIAGAGGDGGLLAERLVRLGVGSLTLADPEVFEESNLNRQFGADSTTLGRNKAEVIAGLLLRINPQLKINIFSEGISNANIHDFVLSADAVIDEIEYSQPGLSVLLNRECVSQNKYMFMGANVGWGCSVFCFSPGGQTFAEYFEYDEAAQTVNLQKYIGSSIDYIPDDIVEAVFSGKRPVPSVSPAVALTAAVVSAQVALFLAGIENPVTVPDALHFDLFTKTNTSIQ
jgi:molybdopterin/thiamine biosynthesis adenylyltransferase